MRVENHGTIVLLRPETDAGRQWLEDHCQTEDWMWFGDALAVEPRYAEPIINGFHEEMGDDA